MGDPYEEEIGDVTDLRGDICVIGLWSPYKMYSFEILVVDTAAPLYEGIHPIHILSHHKWLKRGEYIEA